MLAKESGYKGSVRFSTRLLLLELSQPDIALKDWILPQNREPVSELGILRLSPVGVNHDS
jgi:hypothetical protein